MWWHVIYKTNAHIRPDMRVTCISKVLNKKGSYLLEQSFGVSIIVNDELADVYETGIMVDFRTVYQEKKDRYLAPYIQWKASQKE